MASKLERASLLAQGEAMQRRINEEVASGKRAKPEPRRIGRHKDSDVMRQQRAEQAGEPAPQPNNKAPELPWRDWSYQKQVAVARQLHGGEDKMEAIPTANAAREYLAKHFGG